MVGPLASGNAVAFGNHCCSGGLVLSDLPSVIPELPAANTNEDARKITTILRVIVFILLQRKNVQRSKHPNVFHLSTNVHIAEIVGSVKPILMFVD